MHYVFIVSLGIFALSCFISLFLKEDSWDDLDRALCYWNDLVKILSLLGVLVSGVCSVSQDIHTSTKNGWQSCTTAIQTQMHFADPVTKKCGLRTSSSLGPGRPPLVTTMEVQQCQVILALPQFDPIRHCWSKKEIRRSNALVWP